MATDEEKPAADGGTAADGAAADAGTGGAEAGTATTGGGSRPIARTPKDGRGQSLRARILIALMCVLLGIAIVAQVRQTQGDEFSSLRQDDLVRLLDEVTQRNEQLTAEGEELRAQRSSLQSGSNARQFAEDYLTLQSILAGTVPVEGPGVVVEVDDPDGEVSAQTMVHMLEELRNAGAEAVEVSGVRLTATASFTDGPDGIIANGEPLTSPYEWRAIGNPQTLSVALDIPGGALAGFRNAGATVDLVERDLVQITAVVQVVEPEYAVPVEDEN
ncbi:DUF881 domain-containing protein [Occultella kanbiaonis]|uniref:DUF881 domain-containing protein n=1 Tax=Occultella kanbiaonis TaxID=2675754 RepID=UPI0012B884F5|nr:DUF881 domain-containing protein [Occultella kanbiaonis]